MQLATKRRLQQELDTGSTLEFIYKFAYQARFGDLGAEHELCSVYLGRLERDATANDAEIAALRYADGKRLQAEIESNPDDFTPWFKMEWQRLNEEFPDRLAKYTTPV